jgi:integrase
VARVFKKSITRYKDAAGRQVQKGTPGAVKTREKSAKWYGRVGGKVVALSANKTAAVAMLAELTRKADLARVGLGDKFAEHRRKSLLDHLVDFETNLRASGRDDRYVRQVVSHVRWVLATCKFVFIDDVSASAVHAALARLQNDQGRSAQTRNHYLVSMKNFLNFLVKDQRTAENPVRHLSAGNIKVDRRHDHRAMLPEEIGAVLAAARASDKVVRGLSGEDRYHLYLTALRTGFRAGEIGSLTPESFRLDDDPPVCVLSAKAGKNKKRIVHQPLPPDLVGAMREYLKGKPTGQVVWPGPWKARSAEVLQADLAAAGIPYEVEGPDGPTFNDFHGLRHAFITSLERAGVSVKTAQELARHGDVNLTLSRYTHKTLHDLGAAVQGLEPVAQKGSGAVRERRGG